MFSKSPENSWKRKQRNQLDDRLRNKLTIEKTKTKLIKLFATVKVETDTEKNRAIATAAQQIRTPKSRKVRKAAASDFKPIKKQLRQKRQLHTT